MFYRQKKSRSDFFWRRPLGFFDPTGRPRRQKNIFTPKKNRGAIFFGVDRWGAFSKKRTPKAETNDWLRALIKKRTPKAEKNDWLRALIKKRSAEGGKKRLVTCVDKET